MRVLTAFGVVLLAVAVVAADALLVYRDENLHSDERLIAKAREAGFAEKQLQANGAAVNYAEGRTTACAFAHPRLKHGVGRLAKALPKLAESYHVFAVDCFGHRESAHDASLYSCRALGRCHHRLRAHRHRRAHDDRRSV